MVKSRFNWITILVALPLLAFGFFIFTTSINLSFSNSSINGKWFLLSLFPGTMEMLGIASIILYTKKVVVKEKTILIKYLFLRKEFLYLLPELQGYHRTHHRSFGGTLPEYNTFDIRASDGKLFILNSLEFSNYLQITKFIARNSKSIKIDKWDYWVSMVRLVISSAIISFFITCLILYSGQH